MRRAAARRSCSDAVDVQERDQGLGNEDRSLGVRAIDAGISTPSPGGDAYPLAQRVHERADKRAGRGALRLLKHPARFYNQSFSSSGTCADTLKVSSSGLTPIARASMINSIASILRSPLSTLAIKD